MAERVQDGIPDPILNCILEVCCGSARARDAQVKQLVSRGVPQEHAETCVDYYDEYFDLGPKGTLGPLKKEIARLARGQNG